MKRSLVPVVWIAVVSAPFAVSAQQVSPALRDRVPAAIAGAVHALGDSARARGLPDDPLYEKAIEGGAKQAPPDRIVGAVRQVFGQLASAAEALRASGSAPTPEAIEAGAFALNAGLSNQDVERIVQSEGKGYSSAVALRVAGALAAVGVPPKDVVTLVDATMAQGGPVADLQSLPSQIQAQAARGVPPAAAAEGLARAAASATQGGLQNPKNSSHGRGGSHRP